MDKRLLALYSLAHFWVDLCCALLIFRTLAGKTDVALCLLLYNFCAFALQMPLGLLADRLDRNGAAAAAGCMLTALAYLIPGPVLCAVTAGVGNALFHLGGGVDVLNRSQERAWALGVFVSPGALGLFLGTLWGRGTAQGLWLGPAGLILLGGTVLWLCRRSTGTLRSGNAPVNLDAPGGYGALMPLFLVVVLRSYMGMNQAFPWKADWAVWLTLALVLGKTAGGFALDRLGSGRAAGWSLGLAAALLGRPKLLLLDEPTNGLDPAGIQEMRELISDLPKHYGMTVMVSSHLLSEIDQMATDVGIIDREKLIYQGSLRKLHEKAKGSIHIQVLNQKAAMRILEEHGESFTLENGMLVLEEREEVQVAELVALLAGHGAQVTGVSGQQKSLEDIFLTLTGKQVSL